MDKRDFKNEVYGELSKISKAMSNPHRIEIIDLLAQRPYAVEEIASCTSISTANASQHLQVLKSAGLVTVNRRGYFIYYSLASEKVFDVWRGLRELGIEQSSKAREAVDRFRMNYHSLQPAGIDEIYEKVSKGKITLIDVRPEDEFIYGHIQNALSIPIDKLVSRLEELSKEMEIIVYCRGPFCIYADQAVEILTKEGFNANRMIEGYPDWKSRNFPVSFSA
ncbi:ArsR family transcriptional regulator [Flavobacterium cheongpyeongense]|uniref:ArsR family transcriptional regulator n=1 Tax=Flavobacterium cheongpyeongense TaxID=2212651 RepID=A0A2V4BPQ8_9FLAO|nr:metalloregulator ArsR/SmtB family transcription factor [Flavobacterium cheongpyeongense]PXY40925.1 ArsR family transcriptional regulator [Flavobacterium cheongpyeongense]